MLLFAIVMGMRSHGCDRMTLVILARVTNGGRFCYDPREAIPELGRQQLVLLRSRAGELARQWEAVVTLLCSGGEEGSSNDVKANLLRAVIVARLSSRLRKRTVVGGEEQHWNNDNNKRSLREGEAMVAGLSSWLRKRMTTTREEQH
ncbi:hypothetical protein B296_00052088 [Ensete ventricosum]|uniref:Uncharacterized protein n=1 Tax=Ensete ventricosum TaxID=4639 RepID=A0A426XCR3_ENSVE|nr:hypothetical protein B296_00052088 [Ensete ventricosum]